MNAWPRIRRVGTADLDDLARFYARLEPQTLRERFLGSGRGLSPAAARTFCAPDHRHEEGFVAVVGNGQRGLIVGHVCLAEAGAGRVEIGICVAEAFQGRGLGRRLFEVALAWARLHGYSAIVASCFATNSRVLALLSSAPFGATIKAADAGTVEVVIPVSDVGAPALVASGVRRGPRLYSRLPCHV